MDQDTAQIDYPVLNHASAQVTEDGRALLVECATFGNEVVRFALALQMVGGRQGRPETVRLFSRGCGRRFPVCSSLPVCRFGSIQRIMKAAPNESWQPTPGERPVCFL